MLQNGYMKLVQDGEIFPDTIVDHFTISSTSVMHLGVANDLILFHLRSFCLPDVKVQKPTFTDNVNFSSLGPTTSRP
jgi:hypothetical protein